MAHHVNGGRKKTPNDFSPNHHGTLCQWGKKKTPK
jgi:hypothetical protein